MAGQHIGDEQSLQLAGAAPLGPGLPAPSPGQLLAGLESMRGFKKRVDGLLDELDGSDAQPVRIADDRITPAGLGTGFGEASTLHHSYTLIHEQLTELSRILSGQISALSTALTGARSGYEGVDLDTRDQMWAIQAESERHYDPKHDPYAKEQGTGKGGDGSNPGRSEGTKDKGDSEAGL
ncbi:hypothetical protein LHJ74_15385 [Streptomyces sp. N2-109]|uniref:Uncharacterized protein n=1 Tax=Streptomyces gossypii TaxID=2883101 RepID=A0ABT2JTQ4_9ACTN|nr:hypothetical protein [Streptomyces gossypii]MCT2591272.1 hypothetical protein [Streptomyces gossypii]